MCWTSFRHQILYSYSVQMDHLQRLSPRNWQMKIGKASDVPVNLCLCVTDIIGEFLGVCKSSLPLTAKLFLSVVAVRKTLQAVLSQETPTSWLDQTVLWDLLWSLNHQPLHTWADTFNLASAVGPAAPLQRLCTRLWWLRQCQVCRRQPASC